MVPCPKCDQTGYLKIDCAGCNATGRVSTEVACSACDAWGTVTLEDGDTANCESCTGAGYKMIESDCTDCDQGFLKPLCPDCNYVEK